jgi:hypothetical protein
MQNFYPPEEYMDQVATLMDDGLTPSQANEMVSLRELRDAIEYREWREERDQLDERNEWFADEEFEDVPF